MKRIIFLLSLLIFSLVILFSLSSSRQHKTILSQNSTSAQPARSIIPQKTKSIFIPYWVLAYADNNDTNEYEQVIYFGVSADQNGIIKNEAGYTSLPSFIKKFSEKPKLLAIRMLSTQANISILDNRRMQEKILKESIMLAQDNGFDGIILDFEISVIGFESVTKRITDFEINFAQAVRSKKLAFYTTMYGDTFIRFRPFDVQKIAKASDGIYIMAYDLHKAAGNPGPNFPLKGSEKFGYDFTRMISDFQNSVPNDKLTVIFGLYGYDWEVDTNGQSVKPAEAKSYYKIRKDLLVGCVFSNCSTKRDVLAQENKTTYKDKESKTHTVWFEDPISVTEKTKFLYEQGIGSVSYWALTYF